VTGPAVWKDGAFVKGVAGISDGRQEAGYNTFDVGSGDYVFKSFIKTNNRK